MHPLVPITIIGGGIIAKLLHDWAISLDPTKVFDCSRELDTYYNNYVRLSQKQQAVLRSHRDANRDRIREALQKRGLPAAEFFGQGSRG